MEVHRVFRKDYNFVLLKSNLTFVFENAPNEEIISAEVEIPEIGAKWWIKLHKWNTDNNYSNHDTSREVTMSLKLGDSSCIENPSQLFSLRYGYCAKFAMHLDNPDTAFNNIESLLDVKKTISIDTSKKSSQYDEIMMTVYNHLSYPGLDDNYIRVSNAEDRDFQFKCSVKIMGQTKQFEHETIGNFVISPVVKHFGKFMDSSDHSDFTFVASGREFKVHKIILSMASPYFETMFSGGFKENKNNVAVSNCDPEIFKHLLEYIYKGKMPENFLEVAIELFQMAHMYQIEQLADLCLRQIYAIDIDETNALEIYKLAAEYGIQDLFDMSWIFVRTKMLGLFGEFDRDSLTLEEIKEFMKLNQEYEQKKRKFVSKSIESLKIEKVEAESEHEGKGESWEPFKLDVEDEIVKFDRELEQFDSQYEIKETQKIAENLELHHCLEMLARLLMKSLFKGFMKIQSWQSWLLDGAVVSFASELEFD